MGVIYGGLPDRVEDGFGVLEGEALFATKEKHGASLFLVVCLERQLARQADDDQGGSPMFLFGCEKSFTLQNPEAILNPIWQTPVDEKWHTIL